MKLAIITGADGGMGTEITRAVATAGYKIIMACYRPEKAERVRDMLVHDTGNPYIEVSGIDLASLASVAAFAERMLQRGDTVSLLMNNAGTMSTHLMQTEDGLERTVAGNYVAPFLLTMRLLPLMGKGSRIVNMVSCTYSLGHITSDFFSHGKSGSFWRIPIYSNTKLALWLFTRELSERVKDSGITVNAADPGIVSTNIIRMDMWFDKLTDWFFRPCIRTPKEGAATAIHLLLDEEVSEVTGQMFASCKPKKVKDKFMNHPQAKQLWEDTEKYIEQLRLEESII